ncbi:hypothetical protein ONV78_20835 [Hahella sp. CR1]|uniref:hypothetical protein n=1 Tax=Hahella sp. CR1 TaxID=2992807 RepID=UPI002442CCD5|nr:hypothetical protein [Hahella sp. CR1]MDG9670196.1 hypothetical protein [Hahella sp. CR1]
MCPDRRLMHPIHRQRQAGLGLPAALFVIVILGLLVVAITELERSTAEGVSMDILSTRAFYAAETGAQAALGRLFPAGGADNNCSVGFPDLNFTADGLTGCSASVVCLTDSAGGDDYFTLRSTGSCGGGDETASRTIEVRAH